MKTFEGSLVASNIKVAIVSARKGVLQPQEDCAADADGKPG